MEIKISDALSIVKWEQGKNFEIKLVDNLTGEYLIVDNDFISEIPLKLKEYIPLCNNLINRFNNGVTLSNLSLQ